MAAYHSTKLGITHVAFLEIADARIIEAQDLLSKARHGGAMFLGGCALECYFKAAICLTLKLEGLPEVFKTHNLEALLMYSGLRSELEAQPAVKHNFDTILDGVGRRRSDELVVQAAV